MALNCKCGDTEFFERTTIEFTVDVDGNREEKVFEQIDYLCINCNELAEIDED